MDAALTAMETLMPNGSNRQLAGTRCDTQRKTKQVQILGLLRRKKGATIRDLTKATAWQAHSVRAAITGLRKRGFQVERSNEDGVSRYRIADILDHCCYAWNSLIDQPWKIMSIGTREWAHG